MWSRFVPGRSCCLGGDTPQALKTLYFNTERPHPQHWHELRRWWPLKEHLTSYISECSRSLLHSCAWRSRTDCQCVFGACIFSCLFHSKEPASWVRYKVWLLNIWWYDFPTAQMNTMLYKANAMLKLSLHDFSKVQRSKQRREPINS